MAVLLANSIIKGFSNSIVNTMEIDGPTGHTKWIKRISKSISSLELYVHA
jgi:hypothetical protein